VSGLCVLEDRRDRGWEGREGAGLYVMVSGSKKWVCYGARDGLSSVEMDPLIIAFQAISLNLISKYEINDGMVLIAGPLAAGRAVTSNEAK
jgi:hypothetical protein